MQTLRPIELTTASPSAKELLEGFEKRVGRSSNMLRVMAQSPAILEAYFQFNRSLEQARITPKLRLLIGVTVSQFMGCDYVVSVAMAMSAKQGITPEEFAAARNAESLDPKIAQLLRFVRQTVEHHGHIDPSEVAALCKAGFREEEIVEIIGNIALTVFRCYFNLIVGTEIEDPSAHTVQRSHEVVVR